MLVSCSESEVISFYAVILYSLRISLMRDVHWFYPRTSWPRCFIIVEEWPLCLLNGVQLWQSHEPVHSYKLAIEVQIEWIAKSNSNDEKRFPYPLQQRLSLNKPRRPILSPARQRMHAHCVKHRLRVSGRFTQGKSVSDWRKNRALFPEFPLSYRHQRVPFNSLYNMLIFKWHMINEDPK